MTMLLLLIAALAASAGTSPEYAKLGALVGNFRTEGESVASPFGPPEKCAGTIGGKWNDGHFAVLRDVRMTCSVSGENRGFNVITYKASEKAFTLYVIGETGSSVFGKGTISGDTLQLIWPVSRKGIEYKIRGTGTGLGTERFLWREEYSADGKTWQLLFHSIETRTK